MQPDEEGFLYPTIDSSRCVDCRRCIDVCPLIRQGNFKATAPSQFYVARHKSAAVLWQSTSGGAFTAVSDAVFRQGGVVYGVDYDEDFHVLHRRAETPEQRDRMRISKYVQSNLRDTFTRIKLDLAAGKKVLFSGTPCQAAGLRGFMANSPLVAGLFICDIICHSIPSPQIWQDYKRLLERENGGKLASVQFRSKKDGWSRENSNKGFLFTMENKPEVQEDDRFYHLFFKSGAITRPACSQCRFTDVQRASDLTIADYWGIERYSPEWFNPLGVSLIMVNSPQGRLLFEQAGQDMMVQERPQAEALNEQKRLREPSALPAGRSQFWQEYRSFGLEYVINKYGN
jgi:coenzyme F420-reducing hydrogenase beta subunit